MLREQLPDTEEAAHPQALWLINRVYGEDSRFEGITHDTAQGLVQMLNTIHLRHERAAMEAGEVSPDNDFEEGRNLAVLYMNGRNLEKIQRLTGFDPDMALAKIYALIVRLDAVPAEEKQEYLDSYFADPTPWRRGMAGFDDPKMQRDLVWPYAVRRVQPPTQVVEPGINLETVSFAKIQRIPDVWASPRPEQQIPQYVKVVGNSMLMHPDFPDGIVLDEPQRGLLNIFLQTQPNGYLILRDLTDAWPTDKYGQGNLFVDAMESLSQRNIIFGYRKLKGMDGPVFLLNPNIVFMEERPEYASRVEYPSEFLRLIAQISRDVQYRGVALVENDVALGLGEAFTDELESVFNSDVVRWHEYDHPPTRERADGRSYARRVAAGEMIPPSLAGMPGWTFDLDGGCIVFEEAVDNDLPPTASIVKRPENLSRLWAHDKPLLQRALAIMNLIAYPYGFGDVSAIRQEFHAFRTFDVVTETRHNDGGKKLGGIRPSRRDCDGGYTEFYRRYPELDPRAPLQDVPFLSLEIPVGGWGFFDDRRVQHKATRIVPPSTAASRKS